MTLLSFSQQSNLTTTTGIAGSGTPPVGDVFELPEIGLSFTPCHGSMMAFRASEVVHGSRASESAAMVTAPSLSDIAMACWTGSVSEVAATPWST